MSCKASRRHMEICVIIYRTHLYGDIYSSPGLDMRQKQLLMCAFLGQANMPDELFGHAMAVRSCLIVCLSIMQCFCFSTTILQNVDAHEPCRWSSSQLLMLSCNGGHVMMCDVAMFTYAAVWCHDLISHCKDNGIYLFYDGHLVEPSINICFITTAMARCMNVCISKTHSAWHTLCRQTLWRPSICCTQECFW